MGEDREENLGTWNVWNLRSTLNVHVVLDLGPRLQS